MNRLRIKTCVLGVVSTNCYIVYREGGTQGVIIDPADNAPYILNQCRELGIEPAAVLLTHGHFDHIMAVEDIRRSFRIPVYAGEAEGPLLEDMSLNMTAHYHCGLSVKADRLARDGEVIEAAGFQFHVLATPGHTAGSVCYWIEEDETLLSGDTLFAESLGRTDFPTGSSAAIVDSIIKKLFLLPESTMVYPGHGEPTTIGHEKKYNPVVSYNM